MPHGGWNVTLKKPTDNNSLSREHATHSAAKAVDVGQNGGQWTIQARSEELFLSVPPPVIVDAYCKNYPDAAQKFFQWAEEEARHRRALDEQLVKSQTRDSLLGLCFGLIVALAGLGVAAWAVTCNQPWLAGFLGGGTIVSLAAAFIRGSSLARSPSSQKDNSFHDI